MRETMRVPVSVVWRYDSRLRKVLPVSLAWDGNDYLVSQVGFHHTFRAGRTLMHVFSVVGGGMFFRVVLNTDNLSWQLEEVSDGLPD